MRFLLGFLESSAAEIGPKNRRFLRFEEISRLEAIRSPAFKREFLAGRILAKSLLASFLETAPENLSISATAGLKPLLRPPHSCHFSISHAKGWAACAVSAESVGMDLEWKDASRDIAAIAEVWFHPAEKRELDRCGTGAERSNLFHRLWTVKEAFIKEKCLTVWDLGRLPAFRSCGEGEAGSAAAIDVGAGWCLGVYSPKPIGIGDLVVAENFPLPGFADLSSCRVEFFAPADSRSPGR